MFPTKPSFRLQAVAVLVSLAATLAPRVESLPLVAVLSNHDAGAWTADSGCKKGASVAECNVRVYVAAIRQARESGALLLLLPEAYGLQQPKAPEPLLARVGVDLCEAGRQSPGRSPSQTAVACAAKANGMPVVANFFISLANGTKHITEVVVDASAKVLAVYHKSHLFPTETFAGYKPGPFAPTLFRLANISWGLCICYEGLYPYVTGDWSQFDALQKAGAEAILWSIGGIMPDKLLGARIARRQSTFLYAGEIKADAAAFNSSGSALPRSAVHKLTVANYTASAAVVVF